MVECLEYLQPPNLLEAIHALSDKTGKVAVIAGGTDLLLDIDLESRGCIGIYLRSIY